MSPSYYETSEFLIGSVAVGVIFPESNGSIDSSTENWTESEESLVIAKITDGLNWLAGYYPSAHVAFSMEVNYRVPTSYEPVSRSLWDHGLWITEAIAYLGYSNVLDYVNDLRNRLGTNWAFLIFVVDSSNDADGRWTDGTYAHGPIGGPYMVMTYDGPYKGGITRMPFMTAHETLHHFYATDEYNGVREYSGYLNVSDNDYVRCLMRDDFWTLCKATQEQIGWRDTDADGILDIVDTFPETTLNLTAPNPTPNNILTYTGFAAEVSYPNRNPYTYVWPEHCMTFFPIPRTHRNITINTITNVEYRIDGGAWQGAFAVDGAFDEAQENFTFTTPWLFEGTHTIEVRATNSVGNTETTYATDIVAVIPPAITAKVDIDPDTLNLKSRGKWITAYIQLPEGYNPEDIDASSILLNGTIAPELDQKYGFVKNSKGYLIDFNNDGVLERMVKFDRAIVQSFICNQRTRYGNIVLTIAGDLFDGTAFEGTDTIFVNHAGDANHDGKVNVFDICVVKAYWGADYLDADFNKDSTTNTFDILILKVNWGQVTP